MKKCLVCRLPKISSQYRTDVNVCTACADRSQRGAQASKNRPSVKDNVYSTAAVLIGDEATTCPRCGKGMTRRGLWGHAKGCAG